MTPIYWWRSWHGAPIDGKWPVISARSGVKVGIVSAVAWALMDYASQQKERGSVEGFDTEVYAVYSGFSEEEIIAVIKAMTDKKIIVDGMLSKWGKRQPLREDDSKERTAEYRKRKKGDVNKRSVTQCDAEKESVTLSSLSISNSLSESVNESINEKENPKNKKVYGEFKNVRLTDKDYKTLQEKFPNSWEERIRTLSEGKEMRGYKYKNDYLAILKWASREEENISTKTAKPEKKYEEIIIGGKRYMKEIKSNENG
jgi:hypothetical protein